MSKEENAKKRRKVLDILLSGDIPSIILTAEASDIKIATNAKLWIERTDRKLIYIPVKGQKNGGGL